MDTQNHKRRISAPVEDLRAGGMAGHNMFLQEKVKAVMSVLTSAAMAGADWARRGTMTPQIAAQIVKAVDDAMAEFEGWVKEVLALPPQERANWGVPKRQPNPSHEHMQWRLRREHEATMGEVRAALDELDAAGAYAVIVAPTKPTDEGGKETVQIVGVKLDQLSEATRATIQRHGRWCAAEVRSRRGLVN
jgi:hypothetical protein